MSAPNWTNNQKLAIEAPPCVLVNAAAGSGKTAVLVERIIRKIKSGADIDRLLIVTFARDAAQQMKNRLKKELLNLIKSSDDAEFNKRMKRQLRLLNSSDITTIDAFCINVIKKNFHTLGMDPVFKIIDAGEAGLMLTEAIKDFLNDKYETDDENIRIASENYSDGFSDYSLEKMIEELYKFTRSLENPIEWVKDKVEMYSDFKSSVWYLRLVDKIGALKREVSLYTEQAVKKFTSYALGEEKKISDLNDEEKERIIQFDENLWNAILRDFENSEKMKSGLWDDVYSAATEFSRMAKTSLKGDFKEERKEIIDIKNKAYEAAENIVKLCAVKEEELSELYEKGIYPVLNAFSNLFCEFDKYFMEMKHKKSNYEFNDLEHLCYELLKNHEEVRMEYFNKYDEILMDEYQDTNALQEAIFNLISDKRFMVGDMKQSIYRFRNSDPFIFKEKDRKYAENSSEGTRIILAENFRSRPQVLKSINEIFKRIMSENAGEVNYDTSQELRWGNPVYDLPEDEKYMSELYILEGHDSESEEEGPDALIEANFIAGKIKSMIDSGFEVSEGGKKRKARPGDFVIVQSAVKSTGNIFVSALNKAGLDGYCENEGYFEKTEIKLMLALIEVINNPLKDIPLAAVMRSVIFGFSEEELAKIRLNLNGDFFNAVKCTAKGEGDLAEKCKKFCESIKRWRNYAKYMSADRLIWTVYEETSFYDLMGVLYNGEEAQANLKLLFEKAKQYEKTGFKGLFHFVEYIKKLEQNVKTASASVISDNSNVVRIMTIHKCKGLEFPVCIFAGAGRRFGGNASGRLKLHKDLGIGVRFVNADGGYYTNTAVCELIKEAQHREEQAENLRKMYVGMTRAKEKLIVTGTVKGLKKSSSDEVKGGYTAEKEKWNSIYSPEMGVMKAETVNAQKRFIDWIAPIVLSHKKECGWKSFVVPYAEEENDVLKDCGETEQAHEKIKEELIDELMNTSYDSGIERDVPGKISVTGINGLRERLKTEDDFFDFECEKKHAEGLKNDVINLKRPDFLTEQGLSGVERGTAYHTALALIEIQDIMDEEYVKKQLIKMQAAGKISENERNGIKVSDLAEFFASEIGERMKKSKMVMREASFEIPVNAAAVTENQKHSNNSILVQGVIDCMFEEDGELVLIDYKTDRTLLEEELIKHYKNQLEWYKRAAEALCEKKVKEAYLYSFALKKLIDI